MILVVATVRVHPDKVAEYESACRELMPPLQAANPGIVFYKAGKCRETANTYRVVEAYEDQAAMDRHVTSDALKAAFARLQPCIADLDIKLHDGVD
jgi:quinol monooxygenase YgiN